MYLPTPDAFSEVMSEAIGKAYTDAAIIPNAADRVIVPLGQLVAGQPLYVYEIPNLTRRTATESLSARAGRPLLRRDVSDGADDRLAGFLYANAFGGWILANAGDPLVRRRFTVAHELGHYLIHYLPDGEAEEFDEEIPASADENTLAGTIVARRMTEPETLSPADLARMEDQANRFAAEILMPETVCRALYARYADQCGNTLSR